MTSTGLTAAEVEEMATVKAYGVLEKKCAGDPEAEQALAIVKRKVGLLILAKRGAREALMSSELSDFESVKAALIALGVQVVEDEDLS